MIFFNVYNVLTFFFNIIRNSYMSSFDNFCSKCLNLINYDIEKIMWEWHNTIA